MQPGTFQLQLPESHLDVCFQHQEEDTAPDGELEGEDLVTQAEKEFFDIIEAERKKQEKAQAARKAEEDEQQQDEDDEEADNEEEKQDKGKVRSNATWW